MPSAMIRNWRNDGDCDKCGLKLHPRRRLIICIHGTWENPDGPSDMRGKRLGIPPNVARIRQMVKSGEVRETEGEGNDADVWEQIVWFPYMDGTGAVENPTERFLSGYTGGGRTGYETQVKEIYKYICHRTCKNDELFMFGFSRGAFILRAVSGLLHHMRALKPTLLNFNEEFENSFGIYHGYLKNPDEWINRKERHRKFLTNDGPTIKFLGLFDTVSSVRNPKVYDLGIHSRVHHIRHALALFEKRDKFSPERYHQPQNLAENQTFQEAWFAGTHGNIGGGCEQDGLSLWPLHWIITEAMRYGLKLDSEVDPEALTADPSTLIFPLGDSTNEEIICKNGIRVRLEDLSPVMNKFGSYPRVQTGLGEFSALSTHRLIFEKEELQGAVENNSTGAFIHPSVYYLDQTDPYIINFINKLPYHKKLRAQKSFSLPDESKVFWDLEKEISQRNRASKDAAKEAKMKDADTVSGTVTVHREGGSAGVRSWRMYGLSRYLSSTKTPETTTASLMREHNITKLNASIPIVVKHFQQTVQRPPSLNAACAINVLASKLELEGLNPISMAALIQSFLWPEGPESSYLGDLWNVALPCAASCITGRILVQLVFIAGIVILLSLGFKPDRFYTQLFMLSKGNYILPLICVEIPWVMYTWMLYRYRLALLQIRGGIDILLVLDRLASYGNKNVDELAIRSACLSYLRKSPDVHEKLLEKIKKQFPSPVEVWDGLDAKRLLKEFLDVFGTKELLE